MDTGSIRRIRPDGTEEWHDPAGQLHRDNAPAVIEPDGTAWWYWHGHFYDVSTVTTTPNHPHVEIDTSRPPRPASPPAAEPPPHSPAPTPHAAPRIQSWTHNNQLHRLNGPALIHPDGTEWWYQHGRLHRLDGPAITTAEGDEWWFHHGQLHRKKLPAVTTRDGTQCWYHKGKLHRTQGPAIKWADGTSQWWIRGKHDPWYPAFTLPVTILITLLTLTYLTTGISVLTSLLILGLATTHLIHTRLRNNPTNAHHHPATTHAAQLITTPPLITTRTALRIANKILIPLTLGAILLG